MDILDARHLTKKYGDFTSVDAVDFSIYEGEIFGLIGPNGAGKTTTINMMIGLGGKTVEIPSGMIPNLKVEVLEPVLAKGLPTESDLKALDNLAETIAKKREEHGIK